MFNINFKPDYTERKAIVQNNSYLNSTLFSFFFIELRANFMFTRFPMFTEQLNRKPS